MESKLFTLFPPYIFATMSHLGNNIKKVRKLVNETQDTFATRMGVSIDQQKSYETNRARPDVVYMEGLKALSGIDQYELWNNDVPYEAMIKAIAGDAGKSAKSVEGGAHPKDTSVTTQALLKLADSNAMLSESNLSLARSHEKLVLMLEEKHSSSNGTNYQNELLHQKQVSLILEALAKLGTGKRWKTLEEAYEDLNIILVDPLSGKLKAGKSVGAHK